MVYCTVKYPHCIYNVSMFDLPPIELSRPVVSEIAGTISISCWIIVFIPQIYEIYKTKSTRGLSLHFLVLWLIGDIFNLLGSVIQGLLLTVILLAAYYTLADMVLILQYMVYRRREELASAAGIRHLASDENFAALEPILLSPTTSHVEELEPLLSHCEVARTSTFHRFLHNFCIVSGVIGMGFISWYVSFIRSCRGEHGQPIHHPPNLVMNPWAQVFGYISAVLYLSSRIPQIWLNFKRKSCVGISLLFFLFACLGNMLFIASLLVVSLDPQYLKVNFSWLLGSAGTLLMDLTIFIQFFIYDSDDDVVTGPAPPTAPSSKTSKRSSRHTYDTIDGLDDSIV